MKPRKLSYGVNIASTSDIASEDTYLLRLDVKMDPNIGPLEKDIRDYC